jgi:hypothetical protein
MDPTANASTSDVEGRPGCRHACVVIQHAMALLDRIRGAIHQPACGIDRLPLPREPRPMAINAGVFPTALHASFSDA